MQGVLFSEYSKEIGLSAPWDQHMYSENQFFPMGLSGKDSAADTASALSPLSTDDLDI